ncbi:TIGR04282 family arsenosugar biosynthesis glycosyltransferase [Mycolicibacterium grossiae]|uniref:Glycosyltransferase involved in cell wall biogenesis n=1 Tax=Mycolicibacterium grossiae TaxID=1552759 RepID=A0A1E8PYQ3_9MYCO|nr:DUF2064 domain-containing protein [Mycolicibacterium grossiae]OFJ50970.1 glycosyltransferase involved in cell wall biogenesis [Mycolicibacterium grossiae]QEM45041.1 DUF2064 domain-containing protein [Mycolicibacterium grossiae]
MNPPDDVPCTALVVAKAPVPGLAKTRLAASIGPEAAADVAAAALLDTLDAVLASSLSGRVVAFTGDLDRACRSAEIRARLADVTVVEQRGEDFAERLVGAHADAAAATGHPVLQIGMDTPQVSGPLLTRCARTLLAEPAILGMARDGGWWVLGLHDPRVAQCLRAVPMSQADTGEQTLRALVAAGVTPALVEELADIDTIADLAAVGRECAVGSRTRSVAAVGGT